MRLCFLYSWNIIRKMKICKDSMREDEFYPHLRQSMKVFYLIIFQIPFLLIHRTTSKTSCDRCKWPHKQETQGSPILNPPTYSRAGIPEDAGAVIFFPPWWSSRLDTTSCFGQFSGRWLIQSPFLKNASGGHRQRLLPCSSVWGHFGTSFFRLFDRLRTSHTPGWPMASVRLVSPSFPMHWLALLKWLRLHWVCSCHRWVWRSVISCSARQDNCTVSTAPKSPNRSQERA